MKRAGSHSAFNEAVRFAKDPRPYEVKELEYMLNLKNKRNEKRKIRTRTSISYND